MVEVLLLLDGRRLLGVLVGILMGRVGVIMGVGVVEELVLVRVMLLLMRVMLLLGRLLRLLLVLLMNLLLLLGAQRALPWRWRWRCDGQATLSAHNSLDGGQALLDVVEA